MGDVTHNNNEDNITNTDACCSLPSGSNDWKTLLACSDGDSGPTRDISYRETASMEKQRGGKESMKQKEGGKTEYGERSCVTIRRGLP